MGFFHFWPQIIILALMVFNVLYTMAHEGEPKTGRWDGTGITISTSIQWWVLWMGGFFKEFSWPQLLIAIILALCYLSAIILHGEYQTGKWSTSSAIIGNLVIAWILWMGWFW